MASSSTLTLPPPHWVDLRLPDGTHSGVRVDLRRGLLEVQRRSGKHIFDLAQISTIEDVERICYTEKQQ